MLKNKKQKSGIALVLTIVILVVMATMVYTVGSKLTQRARRNQYMVDYQNARYACDSAMKYSLALIETSTFKLAERPNEPDFSDLFSMDQQAYEDFIYRWLDEEADPNYVEDLRAEYLSENPLSSSPMEIDFSSVFDQAMNMDLPDPNSFDPNDANDISAMSGRGFVGATSMALGKDANDVNDVNVMDVNAIDAIEDYALVKVPGPYGAKWPLVQDPYEFELGTSTVTIEIHDENSKLPLTWAITKDADYKRQAKAATDSFMEWMKLDFSEIEKVNKQLADIGKVKSFSLKMDPIKIKTTETKKVAASKKSKSRRSRRRSRQSRRKSKSRTKTVTKTVSRGDMLHRTDFAKLMNSHSAFDILKKPAIETSDRVESAYKYASSWGTYKININTAPRHVLEAAFAFGGNEVEIADAIIQRRKTKPFKETEELSKEFYQYNDSIEKVLPYIMTESKVFTVWVTATSGVASAKTVAAVFKDGKAVERIAIFTE